MAHSYLLTAEKNNNNSNNTSEKLFELRLWILFTLTCFVSPAAINDDNEDDDDDDFSFGIFRFLGKSLLVDGLFISSSSDALDGNLRLFVVTNCENCNKYH